MEREISEETTKLYGLNCNQPNNVRKFIQNKYYIISCIKITEISKLISGS